MSMTHEITAQVPRFKKTQRKGRGESSGRGKTSGRGNKGSKARVGTYIKRGYEGGQTPIFRRFPKRGFSNFDFERRFYIVNLADLEQFDAGATVDATALKEKGLIPDLKQPVKILGNGELTKKLTILASWYSKSAAEKIAKTGGAAQNIKGEAFAFPKPKKKFIPREGGPGKKKKPAAAEEAPPAAPAAEGAAPAAAPPAAE
ncbi:MAG: large subunit ribosomal protein [Phycisphaerales bacterium]|jgi:large subunit ribosomal protein L15|nr:large subunit ribosomal protein [Phycisphaerales bacterium]